MTALEKLLAEQWVDVRKRLPPDNRNQIIVIWQDKYVTCPTGKDIRSHMRLHAGDESRQITHWQPIIPPVVQEKNDVQ